VLGTPIHPEGNFALINARRDYGAFVVSALEAGQTSGRVLAGTEDVSAAEIAKDIAQGGSSVTWSNAADVDDARSIR
jgi:hypothetical protein